MIYIVRHGQTEMNHRKVLQGRSDVPLNEIGIGQARAAAEELTDIWFDRVYTSPLIRAIQTAKIIVPYVEPVMDERLIEMDYGPYEGCDLTQLPPEIIIFSVTSSTTRLRMGWNSSPRLWPESALSWRSFEKWRGTSCCPSMRSP